MARIGRVRPGLYVAGAALAVGCLVGARALTAGNGPGDGPKTAAPPANGKAGGPVVLGTVDTDPPPVSYGLPPVLPSGSVARVAVKNGQEVKAGDELYAFDAALQAGTLETAKAKVAAARTKVAEAQLGVKAHGEKAEFLKLAVKAAEDKESYQKNLLDIVKDQQEKVLKLNGVPAEEWPARLRVTENYYKAAIDLTAAANEAKVRRRELEAHLVADPEVMVKSAEAAVQVALAEQANAQTALDLCTVRAKTAGTVEQVKISPGSTLGVSSRDPALWLIPAGPRIVRAEVEADFAHRLSNDLIGREVTISDHTDPKLTYKGTVRRVSGTFLPKRSDALIPSDTRVLEAEVEVTDPAPAGRPPLRVGQRVRVNLGQ